MLLNRLKFTVINFCWGTFQISLSMFSFHSSSVCTLSASVLSSLSRGCKAWTTVALYGRSLNIFVAMATDDFLCKVSQCFLCCVFQPIRYLVYVFFGKHTAHFSRFIVQKWPSRPDIINAVMDTSYTWNCVSGKITTQFFLYFLAEKLPHTIRTVKHAVEQYIEPFRHTQ
jgi:hypothetical protein